MTRKLNVLAGALLSGAVVLAGSPAQADHNEITIIHTGDFHGHLIPRANVRSDSVGRTEGGLARIATMIAKIRADEKNVLYVHERVCDAQRLT